MSRYDKLALLGVFHYLFAAFCALGGCFPLLYAVIGVGILTEGASGTNPPPKEAAFVLIGFGVAVGILIWAVAAVLAACGYCLRKQRHHTFCVVIAAIQCINMPLGTILGAFTLVVLMDPHVKAMFDRRCSEAPA